MLIIHWWIYIMINKLDNEYLHTQRLCYNRMTKILFYISIILSPFRWIIFPVAGNLPVECNMIFYFLKFCLIWKAINMKENFLHTENKHWGEQSIQWSC